MIATQTLRLEELEKKELKEIFKAVLANHLILTVRLPNGQEVVIQPKAALKPLPVLKGSVPDGWKDAIYDGGE